MLDPQVSSDRSLDATHSHLKRSSRLRTLTRQRSPAEPSQWEASLSVPLYSRQLILQTATEALSNHLFYARGLSPIPVHQLLATEEAAGSTSQAASTAKSRQRQLDRKVDKTRDSLRQLSSDMNAVLQALPVEHVVLLLGATIGRPKEVYVIDGTALQVASTTAKVKESALASRLLRRVITAECQADSGLARRLRPLAANDKLHLLFGVKTKEMDRILLGSPTSEDTGNVWNKMVLRRDVCLDTLLSKRGVRRIGRIQLTTKGSDDGPAACGTNWISLKTTLRGFHLPT